MSRARSSRRGLELLASITRSEHLGVEPAVMDSQIEQLPDLAGYLKLASHPAWLRVSLPLRQPPAPGRSGTSPRRARSAVSRRSRGRGAACSGRPVPKASSASEPRAQQAWKT